MNIDKETRDKIIELRKSGLSMNEVSHRIGCSFNAVMRALGGVVQGNRHYKLPDDRKEELRPSDELLSVRDELRRVTSENSRLRTEKGYEERLFSSIKDSIISMPVRKSGKPRRSKSREDQQAVLIVTDAHAEELVVPDEMEGSGEYNLDIFESRMEETVSRTAEITNIIRQTSNVDTINVFYLGDWFMGEIHMDESAEGSSSTLQMAVPRVARAIADQVMTLSEVFRHVNVYGIVGNHGRSTRKPVSKARVDRNWDAACYKIAKEFTRSQKNVTWVIPKSIMHVADVMGWKCLITHGDCVKRTSAEPLFALSRMIDMQHKQRRRDGTDFDYAFIGHWHDDSMLHGECEICPPLIGGSQFSRYQCHQSTPPGALLYFFSAEHGKTSRWRLSFHSAEKVKN